MMNIYLMRHGETDWNIEGRIQGHTDIPLNQHGRIQIAQTAAGLADICPDIDLILCSPLSRARESAQIAAERLHYPQDKIIEEPLLIERSFGEAEGLTASEREEKYPDYQHAGIDYCFPGMESLEDLMERAHGVIKMIIDTYKDKDNILVASHGAILYAVISAATGGKIEYAGNVISLDSASLYRVCYTDGAIELAKYSIDESRFSDIYF